VRCELVVCAYVEESSSVNLSKDEVHQRFFSTDFSKDY
jgi:hypothetical protein